MESKKQSILFLEFFIGGINIWQNKSKWEWVNWNQGWGITQNRARDIRILKHMREFKRKGGFINYSNKHLMQCRHCSRLWEYRIKVNKVPDTENKVGNN